MLKRRLPGVYFRGTRTWLYVRGRVFVCVMRFLRASSCGARRAGVREMTQPADAWQKEICAASYRREGGDSGDLLSDRTLRDRQVERSILRADDRISFVLEPFEVRVVGPDVHC